jgi:chaperonin GroES
MTLTASDAKPSEGWDYRSTRNDLAETDGDAPKGLIPLPDHRKPNFPPTLVELQRWAAMPNVAPEIDNDTLRSLGYKVMDGFRIDKGSREDWEEKAKRALEIAKQKREDKSYPFPGAANVHYPLLTTAALQFAARAYPAIISGRDVVKAKMTGADPQGVQAARSARVSTHMSYQCLEEMDDWETETDLMLHQMAIIGGGARKSFWRFENDKPNSVFISLINLIVNQKVKSLENAPRISHVFELYPQEIEERVRANIFVDADLYDDDTSNDDAAPYKIIEQHCYYDLDGDGYPEPWIVTVHERSEQVLRITAGFDPREIKYRKDKILRIPREDYFVVYPFIPDPDGGFYPIGFGMLLESITAVIDSTMNQMLDAGHLQNAGGGFIGSGLSLKKSEYRFEPGVYYTLGEMGQDIRNAIVTMQHPGPSSALFQLLTMMVESAKQITSIQDILTGDVRSQQIQPTTLLALIEQGLKVFTAIYKRIFKALSKEYKILYRLNRKYLSDEEYSRIVGEPSKVAIDYAEDNIAVTPVADPNLITEMQRIARAQLLSQLQSQAPYDKLLDPSKTLNRLLQAAGIDNFLDVLQPPPPPPQATPEGQMQMVMMQKQLEKLQSDIDLNNARGAAHLADTHIRGAKAAAEMDQQSMSFAQDQINSQNEQADKAAEALVK